jgi:hypothetical protein
MLCPRTCGDNFDVTYVCAIWVQTSEVFKETTFAQLSPSPASDDKIVGILRATRITHP